MVEEVIVDIPSENSNAPRYSLLVGLIYLFNLIVGTGALAIPKAFADAGFALGIIVLALLGFISYMTATLVVECMSAANAVLECQRMTALKKLAVKANQANEDAGALSDLDSDDSPLIQPEALRVISFQAKPQFFEIKRQVELGHMAFLFLNKAGELFFYVCLVLYLYGDLAIYGTVVPKSLAHVVCTYTGNQSCLPINETLPNDFPCWKDSYLSRMNVYRIFVACFMCIVGPFVFFNVSKTKYLQFFTSISRWAAFGCMIILTSKFLMEGKGAGTPVSFNFKNFGPLFGVCVYAFMSQHSLPALLTPIRNKNHLLRSVFSVHTLVFSFYACLALTGVFTFASIEDVYTLNFQAPSCKARGRTSVTNDVVIQYFLALFPVFTLSTNFPLIGITLRNNICRLLYKKQEPPKGMSHAVSAPDLLSGHLSTRGHYSHSHGYISQSHQNRGSIGTGDEATDSIEGIANPAVSLLHIESRGRDTRWWVEHVIVPFFVVIPPMIIAVTTQNVEFLVSVTGSFAGAGVQYVMPALLALFMRRKLSGMIGVDSVPNKYSSPFQHVIFLYFLFTWTAVTIGVVTWNVII